jgi:two-component system response regulator
MLLAEDDEDDLLLFQEALSLTTINGLAANEMVTIFQVRNGLQVLDYLEAAQESAPGHPLPDFIVLDLNMPLLNGMSTLQEINKKEMLRSIPVFILTTSRDDRHRKVCEELGCKGFFSKTPSIPALRSIIEKIVTGS